MRRTGLLLVGCGLIGARHARLMAAHPGVRLAGIVDPAPGAAAVAAELGVPHHAALDTVGDGDIAGAVIATPNHRHAEDACAVAARGWGALIEKPLADTPEAGRRIVEAFAAAGQPALVGHHRRHHAFVAEARRLIAEGALGRLCLVSAIWSVRKPGAYFAEAWRTQPGAGPILINLVHEIDLMRWLVGEITEIRALASDAQRGHAVEDTAAIALRFAGGALGTVALGDAGLSPWSFEAACGENPGIAYSGAHSWRIVGTRGALEFPALRLWSAAGVAEPDWSTRLAAAAVHAPETVPLAAQLDHFLDVLARRAAPLVDAMDGLRTLETTLAVIAAARETGTAPTPARRAG